MKPYFSDAEVDEMCAGLTQDAAKARFLRKLGLRVDRKPNGRPLVWRPTAQAAQNQDPPAAPSLNVVGLQVWARGRKGGNGGQKAQGR
jgi:hypothetical protein